MAAREQAGDGELYRLVLTYDDFTNLLRESLDVIRHSGTICGNNTFRKHDVRGVEFPACYFCRCSCFVVESDKSSFSSNFRIRFAASLGFTACVLYAFLFVLTRRAVARRRRMLLAVIVVE